MGFAISLLLIAAGAILTFAVNSSANGVNLDMVGWILMAVGALGLLASIVLWSSWGTVGFRRRSVTERRSTVGGDVIVQDETVR